MTMYLHERAILYTNVQGHCHTLHSCSNEVPAIFFLSFAEKKICLGISISPEARCTSVRTVYQGQTTLRLL